MNNDLEKKVRDAISIPELDGNHQGKVVTAIRVLDRKQQAHLLIDRDDWNSKDVECKQSARQEGYKAARSESQWQLKHLLEVVAGYSNGSLRTRSISPVVRLL